MNEKTFWRIEMGVNKSYHIAWLIVNEGPEEALKKQFAEHKRKFPSDLRRLVKIEVIEE